MARVDVTCALPAAADSATAVFRGDAGLWLPEPVERRPGPSRWLLYPGTGPVGVAVDARVGEAWGDGPTTWRLLRWEPSGGWSAEHLPAFDGDVGVRALPDAVASLVLRGSYRPPHGLVGAAADRLVLHRVATATAQGFLEAVGRRLALACRPTTGSDPAPIPAPIPTPPTS